MTSDYKNFTNFDFLDNAKLGLKVLKFLKSRGFKKRGSTKSENEGICIDWRKRTFFEVGTFTNRLIEKINTLDKLIFNTNVNQEQDLSEFKNSAFCLHCSKNRDGVLYELGIDGHSNYVIREEKKIITASQTPFQIIGDWNNI